VTAERLLQLFDRVADARDSVPRMRRLVLDLAVRGRLTGHTGKARVPPGWRTSRLADLLAEDTRNGYGAKPVDDPPGVPLLRISAGTARLDGIVAEEEHKFVRSSQPSELQAYRLQAGDLLACRFNGNKASVGRLALFTDYLGISPIFPDKLIRVRVSLDLATPEFVRLASWSDIVRADTETYCATTVGNWGISASNLKEVRYPLPPLDEQRRIVAKVDELMALCDQFELAQREREAARDRLTDAMLVRLTSGPPVSGNREVRPRSAPESVGQLTARSRLAVWRQTILDLAVRGRLARQVASEAPPPVVTALRTRIDSAQVAALPFEVPGNWVVAALSEACDSVTDGDHLPPPRADSGVPFLVIGNIRTGRIDFSGERFVASAYFEGLDPIRKPKRGDLLYTLVGSFGIPVVVRDDREFCVQRHIGILRPAKCVDVNFLSLAMASRAVFSQAAAIATGIAQKTVPLTGLRRIRLPLPPLAEQQRIVAKVEALVSLCDRLEASLREGDDLRSRLLDSLLAEALAPVEPAHA